MNIFKNNTLDNNICYINNNEVTHIILFNNIFTTGVTLTLGVHHLTLVVMSCFSIVWCSGFTLGEILKRHNYLLGMKKFQTVVNNFLLSLSYNKESIVFSLSVH
uniref:Uncharacterized protein n=1 Tax=Cacopsylla melanoneura TaxID=428564 RepID=A0A8D8YHI5_9HEMI